MIPSFLIPNGFMVQGFLMSLAAAYLIVKFRDKDNGYRGR